MNLLQVGGLGKRFGGLEALKDVSLAVHHGEILGLIGPNGAGKSTLFNLVSGHLKPNVGVVAFDGHEIQGRPAHAIARLGIARTFQIAKPFAEMTVLENVIAGLGVLRYPTLQALLASYRGAADQARALALIEQVGLMEYRHARADTLSIGMHRRLEIARALALKPKLFLLDEPTAGLTHQEADQIGDLIRDLIKMEQGEALVQAVVLIEHNMPFAMRLCDRIVVLNFGQLIAKGTPEEVRQNPKVIEAYLGQAADA